MGIILNCMIDTEPVRSQGGTRIGSTHMDVEIDAIKKVGSNMYQGRLVNKFRDAPFNSGDWCGFRKCNNKHIKLPVIKEINKIVEL